MNVLCWPYSGNTDSSSKQISEDRVEEENVVITKSDPDIRPAMLEQEGFGRPQLTPSGLHMPVSSSPFSPLCSIPISVTLSSVCFSKEMESITKDNLVP